MSYSMLCKQVRAQIAKKKLLFGEDCSAQINNATQMIARVAGITLGPKGRNILIQHQMQSPRITKDGVTVVKHLEFEDRFHDAVANLIKKSVDGTNKFAGDGTTTSALLIGQIVRVAMRKKVQGASMRNIKEGLKVGRDIGIDFLESVCRKISTREEFHNVAMVSTNGRQDLSQLISEVVCKASTIRVQRSNRAETFVEYYSGVKMARGIPHPDCKNYGEKLVYDYPLVLVSEKPILSIESIVPALELAKKARKQLLIITCDFSEAVLSTLIYNKRKKIVEACAIKLTDYGTKYQNLLKDIAEATGAYIFDQYNQPIETVDWRHLGKANRVTSDEIQTWIQAKENRQTVSAVIYVGGGDDTTQLQTYDKVIDALNSVQNAKKHGIVAGGGVTYYRLAELLETYTAEFQEGVHVLAEALKLPRKYLVRTVSPHLRPLSGENWEGYNFRTGKIEDMFMANVVDSVTVGKSVLIDSVSLGHLLIDIDVAVMRQSLNIDNLTYKQLARKFKL